MGKTQKVHKIFVGNVEDNRNFEGHSGHWTIILKPLKLCVLNKPRRQSQVNYKIPSSELRVFEV
jgi:hypothetical protein